MISLVNVLLLVGLFFLFGRSVLFQTGIRVELPKSAIGYGYPATFPIVTLLSRSPSLEIPPATGQQGGEPLIFFEQKPVSLQELSVLLDRPSREPGEKTLILRADQGVPYGRVMEVMNVALEHHWTVVLATAKPETAQ